MLKEITFGQYFPGGSVVHRMDPRMKLVLTVVYVVMLFVANSALSLGLCALFSIALYPISHIPIKMAVKNLKPIVPIILFTAIINMFFIVDGEVLFSWWILTITVTGLTRAVFLAVRIICLITGTSLMTYTTSPIALTDGIEQLFSPLSRIRVPVHEISMMMTIALRFIPTLIEETDKIMSAQKARGADMESGNLMQRVRALVPILIPLFVSAFRRAEELALAMECRCYHGGEGRTRMRQLRFGGVDIVAAAFMTAIFAGVVAANMMLPKLY